MNPRAPSFIPASVNSYSTHICRHCPSGDSTGRGGRYPVNTASGVQTLSNDKEHPLAQMVSEDYATKMQRWLDMGKDEYCYVGDKVPNWVDNTIGKKDGGLGGRWG
jgi:hypothetical protein